MSKLPSVSGLDALKAFQMAGWLFVRQRGSHMIMTKEGMEVTLSIPNHKTLKKPLLKILIKNAGLNEDNFILYHCCLR
jgi:predicted RNA binding protein YcfA (HicA-like mRNA interferase family)